MKLFVSVLFLAAATGFAQVQTAPAPAAGVAVLENDLIAHRALSGGSCPVILQSADVGAGAGVLPVAGNDGYNALDLRYLNRSGKEIRSASITAQLRVKTNKYSLDATSIDLRLSFSGGRELNRAVNQLAQIAMPPGIYLFGVARVSLDSVTFADNSTWVTPSGITCSVAPQGIDRIEAK